jgi:hypothetical protein
MAPQHLFECLRESHVSPRKGFQRLGGKPCNEVEVAAFRVESTVGRRAEDFKAFHAVLATQARDLVAMVDQGLSDKGTHCRIIGIELIQGQSGAKRVSGTQINCGGQRANADRTINQLAVRQNSS